MEEDEPEEEKRQEIDWSKVGTALVKSEAEEVVIGDADDDDRDLSMSLARYICMHVCIYECMWKLMTMIET